MIREAESRMMFWQWWITGGSDKSGTQKAGFMIYLCLICSGSSFHFLEAAGDSAGYGTEKR